MTQGDSTTYTYQAMFGNLTVNQSFAFSTGEQNASFVSGYTVPASNVKWAIDINSVEPFPDGLSISYLLSALSFADSILFSYSDITYESSAANITTYYIPLAGDLSSNGEPIATRIDVFDVALLDGVFQPISHYIAPVSPSYEDSDLVLVLQFPGFNTSLLYDPVLGYGALLGSSGQSSSSNVGLIVGSVVGVSGAILLVIGVITASLVVGYICRRRRANRSSAVNFDAQL